MLKMVASVLLAMIFVALAIRLAAVGILLMIVLGLLKTIWRSA
jgi:hypothetical protein